MRPIPFSCHPNLVKASPALISRSVLSSSSAPHLTSPHLTSPHHTSPHLALFRSWCKHLQSSRKKQQHTHLVLETSSKRGSAPTTLICNAHCRLMHCHTNSKQSSRSCNGPRGLPHCAAPFIPDTYAHKTVERAKNLRKRHTWHQDSSSTGIPPRP